MKVKKYRYFVSDFETTVYKGQVNTEVWASATVELYTEDVKVLHSIDETLEYFYDLNDNIIVYFHNLKFDGSFWLSYLITELKLEQAIIKTNATTEFLSDRDMKNNTFKYSISQRGAWYSITIKHNYKFIEIRDSLKLLPFSVKQIGESFKTKHRKLDMEYTGFRYAGCEITEEEKKYIINDVLVPKEALEIMFEQGHKELTIGSCCLKEYKQIIGKYDYEQFFPDVSELLIDKKNHTYSNVDEWVRKSYRGGWCYLVKGKENKIFKKGLTADVNSLYSSMMHSDSKNRYPVGKPCFWSGNFIPPEAISEQKYYFVRIKTRFYLKKNMLPFVQIKSSFLYKGTEALETSDVYNVKHQAYYSSYELNGKTYDTRVELTLTMTDYELLKEHYELVDFEILDGCWFYSQVGIFDEYINKYKEIKQNSKGAVRESAKLFLNNLYGKLASSKDSSFKVAYEKTDQSLGFVPVLADNKKAGYIPVGSAITSYARNFTIRTAQKNYYGKDKRGFIYADTDSIHCDLEPEEIKGIEVHETDFCCWKLESSWDEAIFVRQKTYIEHVIAENLKKIEAPYYSIKCAGMQKRSKKLFERSIKGEQAEETEDEEIKEFLSVKRNLTDFKRGLKIPNQLKAKRISGGILLIETPYEMR